MGQREIYEHHADRYDELVEAEDCDHSLLPAIRTIVSLDGARVIEVGAGTGRLTRLLLRHCAEIVATDRSPAMLEVARRHLSRAREGGTWRIAQAEAHALPCPTGWADIAVAGWVFGHFQQWLPSSWRESVASALEEMARVLREGGTTLLVETLGTGSEVPRPPHAGLADYYHWLESTQGFRRVELRTDYLFSSVEQAAEVTGFFFGEPFAARVRERGWARVPECTGLWWRTR